MCHSSPDRVVTTIMRLSIKCQFRRQPLVVNLKRSPISRTSSTTSITEVVGQALVPKVGRTHPFLLSRPYRLSQSSKQLPQMMTSGKMKRVMMTTMMAHATILHQAAPHNKMETTRNNITIIMPPINNTIPKLQRPLSSTKEIIVMAKEVVVLKTRCKKGAQTLAQLPITNTRPCSVRVSKMSCSKCTIVPHRTRALLPSSSLRMVVVEMQQISPSINMVDITIFSTINICLSNSNNSYSSCPRRQDIIIQSN